MKPRLTTVKSEWSFENHQEFAICPECGHKNIAEYKEFETGERLIITDGCYHFSDLVSTGGNGVGFMFYVIGGKNEIEM